MKKKLTLLIIVFTHGLLFAGAQCNYTNTAFSSGEELSCNLYFNWKFVWIKAGEASLTVYDTFYQNKPAYHMRLLCSTNHKVDAFFKMKDTLEAVFSHELQPLYFRKGAFEGKRYTNEEIWYSYLDNNQVKVYQRRLRYNGEIVITNDTTDYCVFDMLSLLARARSFDYETLKKGATLTYPVATGSRIENQKLVYKGTKTIKSDNDKKRYRCLEITLLTPKKEKDKELITFYVTDDENHLPILLDLNLNFGSAKAMLTEAIGNRYPIEAVVKK